MRCSESKSGHVTRMVQLVAGMVTNQPGNKIVLVSQSLKYSDLVAKALHDKHRIICIRFDGTVNQAKRRKAQEDLADPTKASLLLMTAGAGGVGLNLTSGKTVIIEEEWWNNSVEKQTISRCHRQGAAEEVTVIKWWVENSMIDGEVTRVRESKVKTNTALMAPLVHKHDEILQIIELLH